MGLGFFLSFPSSIETNSLDVEVLKETNQHTLVMQLYYVLLYLTFSVVSVKF